MVPNESTLGPSQWTMISHLFDLGTQLRFPLVVILLWVNQASSFALVPIQPSPPTLTEGLTSFVVQGLV